MLEKAEKKGLGLKAVLSLIHDPLLVHKLQQSDLGDCINKPVLGLSASSEVKIY